MEKNQKKRAESPNLRIIARKLDTCLKKQQEEFRKEQPLWRERYPRREELQMMVSDFLNSFKCPVAGLDVGYYIESLNGELFVLMTVLLQKDHPLFAAHIHQAEYNRCLKRPFFLLTTQYTDGIRVDKVMVNPQFDGDTTLEEIAISAVEDIATHQRAIREDATLILSMAKRMNLSDAQLQGLFRAMEHVFASVQPGETIQALEAIEELVYGSRESVPNLQKMLIQEIPTYAGIRDLPEIAYPVGRRVWLILPPDKAHPEGHIVKGRICKNARKGVSVEVEPEMVSSATTIYTFSREDASSHVFLEPVAAKRFLKRDNTT